MRSLHYGGTGNFLKFYMQICRPIFWCFWRRLLIWGAKRYPCPVLFIGGAIAHPSSPPQFSLQVISFLITISCQKWSVSVSRDCPNFLSTRIISGTGKATNFKFCTHILSIDRNKSPLQISGKVAESGRQAHLGVFGGENKAYQGTNFSYF